MEPLSQSAAEGARDSREARIQYSRQQLACLETNPTVKFLEEPHSGLASSARLSKIL
jgi:hypothetical protein